MKEFIRQDLYDNLLKSLKSEADFIQVVVGPRQVGKTTLVLQMLKRWEGSKLYETADIPGTPPLLWLEKVWNQFKQTFKVCLLL